MRATAIVQTGHWPHADAIDTITLDFDHRCRRRIALKTDRDRELLLDLAQATAIRDGDALRLTDGRLIGVKAAAEPLLEVTCASPDALARIAWHLGNRHLPIQIAGDRIRIRDDHVIADMLDKLGAETKQVNAPFDPEGGAYGAGQVHGHSH